MARIFSSSNGGAAMAGSFMAHDDTRNWLEQESEYFRDRVIRYRGEEYLNNFDNDRMLDYQDISRKMLSLGRHQNNAYRDETIYDLQSTQDFQHAPNRLVDLLLQNPYVNRQFRNQAIDGWDRDIATYGHETHQERRASRAYASLHDGLSQNNPNGKDIYFDEYLDKSDLDILTAREKISACRSIDRLVRILEKGDCEDPTSLLNKTI